MVPDLTEMSQPIPRARCPKCNSEIDEPLHAYVVWGRIECGLCEAKMEPQEEAGHRYYRCCGNRCTRPGGRKVSAAAVEYYVSCSWVSKYVGDNASDNRPPCGRAKEIRARLRRVRVGLRADMLTCDWQNNDAPAQRTPALVIPAGEGS
jgi:hypothetical protein